MFAGIGPFAVPAAKKGCIVHANDLNPDSYSWCQENFYTNLAPHELEKVKCYNLDARLFVRDRIRQHQESQASRRVHIICNLPASAPEFMDAFSNIFTKGMWAGGLPTVHLYAFSKDSDPRTDVLRRASLALGTEINEKSAVCREVRLVAPGKLMVCVSFSLPQDILC